ncbi:hypothetical protein T440DRAFT_229750 [Plenodomus tracheiphilus IPT5]|uniref:Uncharacterized protein n=1 Tax=Plenodomus tracheiphilus IPT5 TaxID=1408161 RepID=A0A6A7AW67_9PLEO|nr:hypothetical protein T440DRAFT_229750 [Plenodomus tracheiphilus IPT5]
MENAPCSCPPPSAASTSPRLPRCHDLKLHDRHDSPPKPSIGCARRRCEGLQTSPHSQFAPARHLHTAKHLPVQQMARCVDTPRLQHELQASSCEKVRGRGSNTLPRWLSRSPALRQGPSPLWPWAEVGGSARLNSRGIGG